MPEATQYKLLQIEIKFQGPVPFAPGSAVTLTRPALTAHVPAARTVWQNRFLIDRLLRCRCDVTEQLPGTPKPTAVAAAGAAAAAW
jgi:hypothetical protein